MRFCEFIDALFKESSCSSQGQFVLEIFSALCGEPSPKTTNHEAVNSNDTAICSPFLPVGLSNPSDASYRKQLFQNRNNKGKSALSARIRTEILKAQNQETFISYCKSTFSESEKVTRLLCKNLGISDKPRDVLFTAIYDQFIEFAKSPYDDVDSVMEKHELTKNNNLRPRNEFFSGRNDKLDSIEDLFRRQKKDAVNIRQTISGLGGIGKTQLAIEYAYRYCGNYINCIWFVIAESSTTVYNHFKDFADCLKLPLPAEFNPDDLQREVKHWLAENSNWLIIFDNLDSADVITPYLPQKYTGRIIITSRSANINFGTSLELGVFDADESLSFLKRRFSEDDNLKMENYKFDDFDEYAPKLTERLGHLPLALEQAAAYIKKTNGYRISDYLKLLGESSIDAFADEDAKALYYESVVKDTFDISFESLSTSAQYIMNLCAYMAPDRIPVSFFVEMRKKLPSPLCENLETEQKTIRVFNDIKSYSLANGDAYFINIHRLVQEVTRKKHEVENEGK